MDEREKERERKDKGREEREESIEEILPFKERRKNEVNSIFSKRGMNAKFEISVLPSFPLAKYLRYPIHQFHFFPF